MKNRKSFVPILVCEISYRKCRKRSMFGKTN